MILSEVLDAYDAAWNERDERARLAHLERAFADDGVYRDPTMEAAGRAAISDYIGQMFEAFGPFRIKRTSGHDQHHGYARFTWRMSADSGETIVEGFDVIRIAGDGRLQEVIGFFGPFPER